MREKKRFTKRELVEGVEWLDARFAPDGMEQLNLYTGTFLFEMAAPASRALEARGLDGETASAVMDLALALRASEMTPDEAFRLGTSEDALSLFESRSSEWQTRLRWRAEQAAGNIVKFRRPKR